MRVSAFLFVALISASQANASSVRISCDDSAQGGEVTVNGKFKGECPLDVQVPAGTVTVKVTKSIAGKPNVFEQTLRLGDDVVKRIDVTFGAAAAPSAAPAVDQRALDQQRYELEMTQYRTAISSCLPKHAAELQRVTRAVQRRYQEWYQQCRADALKRGFEDGQEMRVACGERSLAESDIDDAPQEVRRSPEYRAWRDVPGKAETWCEKQFSKPRPPAS